MKRRAFVQSAFLGSVASWAGTRTVTAAPPMKITRIRYYRSPNARPIFTQSTNIVTVETDQGITGVGEGGSRDTVEQCSAMLIGEDPSRIEHLWQLMYRGYFYPPGREKLHALGALDMALWDIKGKALGVPVHELLGGLTRDHIECYSTAFPSQGSYRETAQACMEAGFRAIRIGLAGPGEDQPFDSRRMVQETAENCRQTRLGVGKDGNWAIDYHTRLDPPDAVRLSTLIEDLEPTFVEDLVRSDILYRFASTLSAFIKSREGVSDLLILMRQTIRTFQPILLRTELWAELQKDAGKFNLLVAENENNLVKPCLNFKRCNLNWRIWLLSWWRQDRW